VDTGQTISEAAIREAMEEAGVDIDITGVLRIEMSQGRLRVIYRAQPKATAGFHVPLKGQKGGTPGPDKESKGATWATSDEVKQITRAHPDAVVKFGTEDLHLRGNEPLHWFQYLQNDGYVAPVDFFKSSRCGVECGVGSKSVQVAERCVCDMKVWVRLVVVDSVQAPTQVLFVLDKISNTWRCPGTRVTSGRLTDTTTRLSGDVTMQCLNGTAGECRVAGILSVEHFIRKQEQRQESLIRAIFIAEVGEVAKVATEEAEFRWVSMVNVRDLAEQETTMDPGFPCFDLAGAVERLESGLIQPMHMVTRKEYSRPFGVAEESSSEDDDDDEEEELESL